MHYFILLFYFNFITWPHLWNMEILGSESNPSFSCGIARYLNHLPQLGTKSRYRTQASATQDTAVKSLTHCTTAGTPKAPFYFQIPISQFYFILFFIIYIYIYWGAQHGDPVPHTCVSILKSGIWYNPNSAIFDI